MHAPSNDEDDNDLIDWIEDDALPLREEFCAQFSRRRGFTMGRPGAFREPAEEPVLREPPEELGAFREPAALLGRSPLLALRMAAAPGVSAKRSDEKEKPI